MKAHIGVDSDTGIVHSMTTAAANAHDVTETHHLLHGGETVVWGDAGYQGVHKREENLGLDVEWRVAMRPGRRRKLEPGSAEALTEQAKASVRAKVEHPFLKLKRWFGYGKVRYRGAGEEHGAAGIAVRAGEPADGGAPTGGVARNYCRTTPVSRPHQASNSPFKEETQGVKRRLVSRSRSFHLRLRSVIHNSGYNALFRGFLANPEPAEGGLVGRPGHRAQPCSLDHAHRPG